VRVKIALIFVVALLFATAAYAHHSFAATYRLKDTVTIEGKVTRLMIRNPHSMLEFEVRDPNGSVQHWSAEWGAANQLSRAPWTKTLRPGDPVIVSGNPARAETNRRMRLTNLKRTSDGMEWGRDPGEVVD
jgi:hypothetical protein